MLTAESILAALAAHRARIKELFRRKVDLVDRDTIKSDLKPYILRSVRYAPGV